MDTLATNPRLLAQNSIKEYSKDFALQAINDIKNRVPLRIIQTVFKKHGVQASNSLKNLHPKVAALLEEKPETLGNINAIVNWYIDDYLHYGEKTVFIHKLAKERCLQLIEILQTLTLEETIYANSYPFCVPSEQLLKEGHGLYLVKKEYIDKYFTYTFAATRYHTQKVDVSIDHLKQTFVEMYGDANDLELTAKWQVYLQLFDAIAIDAEHGLIEIRIDTPNIQDGSVTPQPEIDKAHEILVSYLENLMTRTLEETWVLPQAINLLPTMDRLYRSQNEGIISYLAFITEDDGSKELRKNQHCCRYDPYHKAGCDAVKHALTPYRLKAHWRENEGYLSINGSVYNVRKVNNPVHGAIITRTIYKENYFFIIERLLKYS